MTWFTRIITAQLDRLRALNIPQEIIDHVMSQPPEVKGNMAAMLIRNPASTLQELNAKFLQSNPIEETSVSLYDQNIFLQWKQKLQDSPIQNLSKTQLFQWATSQYKKLESNPEKQALLIDSLGLIEDFIDAVPNYDIRSRTFDQVFDAQEEWHMQAAEKGKYLDYEPTKPENIIHQFKDGWTFQKVNSENDLLREGYLMDHCVGEYWDPQYNQEYELGYGREWTRTVSNGGILILSLRDPSNIPHVTIESDPGMTNFEQIMGKANSVPKPEYWEYIAEAFGKKVEPIEGHNRYIINEQYLFDNGKFEIKYKNDLGQLHREDGPAIIDAHGRKEWRLNGKRHRVNGPAIEGEDGRKEWFLNGIRTRIDGPAIIDPDGTEEWHLDGELHRADGPAWTKPNGDEHWYWKGDLHRIGGPAMEDADGSRAWYLYGQCHREDGPAIEEANGRKYWFLYGVQYNETNYWIKLKELGLGKYKNNLEDGNIPVQTSSMKKYPFIIYSQNYYQNSYSDEMYDSDTSVQNKPDESQEIAMVPESYQNRSGPKITINSPNMDMQLLTNAPNTEYTGLSGVSQPAGQMVLPPDDQDIVGTGAIKLTLNEAIKKKDQKIWIEYITMSKNNVIRRNITPDLIFVAGTGNEIVVSWDHDQSDWRAFIIPRIQRIKLYQLSV